MRTSTQSVQWAIRAVTILALIGGAYGCGDDAPPGTDASTPMVTIAGDHGLAVGATTVLSASTVVGTDASYTWASTDVAVATVDATGMVTGVAAGETTITATGADTGAVGMHAIVVTTSGPYVTVTGAFYVLTNDTAALTATTTAGTDSSYAWTSSDEAVGTVAADGTFTGRTPGEVTITATGADTGAAGSLGIVVSTEIPNYDAWANSAHADATAEAFRHWDEDDPAEIPTDCARCHSSSGYQAYTGADGSPVEVVENPVAVGEVVDCVACHNEVVDSLDNVLFPSGVRLTNLGPEARCMTCHQGRASTDDVDDAIDAAMPADDDTVSADLGFINIHYYAAGATLNAGQVRGGYQYADQVYDWRFRHVEDRNDCIGCHDQHSLEVRFDACVTCHDGTTDGMTARDIRMMASATSDYDGDGDLDEGGFYEMVGLGEALYTAIQAYPATISEPAICYHASNYPYWFIDTDANGTCEDSEANYGNKYASWTARLLRAAYNYQVALKDPGGFAHNAKYMIQLLFDSLTDINSALTVPADLSAMVRNDTGHFNGASEASRHWDEDETVSSSCSKCHGGAEGFRFFVEYGVGTEPEVDNGLECGTCHETYSDVDVPADAWAIIPVDDVLFPSGVTVEGVDNESNVCMTCHSGRESQAGVDERIDRGSFSFRNVHYLPSGATVYGSEVNVGYQFLVSTMYSERWTGHPGGESCVDCHSPTNTEHTFMPQDNADCTSSCHSGTPDVNDIRMRAHHVGVDFDGDGSSTEPLGGELEGLSDGLLAAIQAYATTPICYNSHAYPYWFVDDNDSGGECETGESTRYAAWDAELMRTTFNFQFNQKDPGAWAHNFDYMAQILIDAIDHVGGDITGYVRPAAVP